MVDTSYYPSIQLFKCGSWQEWRRLQDHSVRVDCYKHFHVHNVDCWPDLVTYIYYGSEQKRRTYKLFRYVQRRLEKSMRGAMACSNTRTYSRVATLIVESGVLYAASQVHHIFVSVILEALLFTTLLCADCVSHPR
jgi:hypothetical protein